MPTHRFRPFHAAATFAAASAVILVAAASQPAAAQQGAPGADTTATSAPLPFEGSWTYGAQSGNPIQEAIERGTADMNFVTRPIARRRLRATNDPYTTMQLSVRDGVVTTVLEGRAIRSPADGSAIAWTREDGEVLQVSTSLRDDGALVQTFVAEDGERENVYSVSADGRRLTLHVTIRSPRLPAPITYRLAYERA